MLMNSVRKIYREMTGKIERAQPVVRIPENRPAANAGRYGSGEMQTRRMRRQRRLERTQHRANHGWAIRTW